MPRRSSIKSRSHSKASPYGAPKSRARGKDSHLYTDDNPATTLHGTGFKDAAIAEQTIELVSRRSLTYQFQTINTMFHRAKHHKQFSSSPGMQAATALFRVWLDEVYPTARRRQPEFKPVLSREVVQQVLDRVGHDLDTVWAQKYVSLPKGKRLANSLMDDDEPGKSDLERYRADHLAEIVDQKKLEEGEEACWRDGDEKKGLSDWHVQCAVLGWSPVGERRLAKVLGRTTKSS